VYQPFAREERLLTGREHELFSAVAAGQRPIDEHLQASPPPSALPERQWRQGMHVVKRAAGSRRAMVRRCTATDGNR
jgi:hypothetical protein